MTPEETRTLIEKRAMESSCETGGPAFYYTDYEYSIHQEDVAMAIRLNGVFEVELTEIEREVTSTFPLSHTDSMPMGMGEIGRIRYSVKVVPATSNSNTTIKNEPEK